MTAKQTVKATMPPIDMVKRSQVDQLKEENLKLRRVLMEQPDYSPLIIQLGEALLSESQEQVQTAVDAYHAWQEGEL